MMIKKFCDWEDLNPDEDILMFRTDCGFTSSGQNEEGYGFIFCPFCGDQIKDL